MATVADLRLPKVTVLSRFLAYRPHMRFHAIQEPSESPATAPMFKQADCIVCCSNTVSSRRACVLATQRYQKPLIDVAVADGRQALVGSIRMYEPTARELGACPMCYLQQPLTVRRDEGLLSTVVATIAAYGAHVVLEKLLEPRPTVGASRGNLILVNFTTACIDSLIVQRRKNCSTCADIDRS
jgi:molybdopterin/thiamine biosynthesis adenylyltransferase